MKKLFPIAMIAFVAITFTSCKKDYTCSCSYTTGGVTTQLGNVTIHDTKSNAKSKCNSSASVPGATVSCSIQ